MNLRTFFAHHKARLLFTLLLILMEAGTLLLFPLFIGYALDGVIKSSFTGVYQLGFLGLTLLIVGVGRRMFDSRFYGKVYQQTGLQVVGSISDKSASIKSARLNMMKEFIEFLENELPEIINAIIGLVGVVILLATLNTTVFYGSLTVTVVIFLIYWLTSGKTIRYNKASNNELECQVDVLSKNDAPSLNKHLKLMTKWNIKLSDLEAINFSISWIVALGFLVMAIVVSVGDGIIQYGALFAMVMYVFQYIENVLNLPLFYQNWLRLREILNRLSQ